MSVIFECEGTEVWSPSLAVGSMVKSFVANFSESRRLASGVTWLANDLADIDKQQFGPFVERVVADLETSHNEPWRSIVEPFAVLLLALSRRCGLSPIPSSERVAEQVAAALLRMPQ